MTKRTKTEKAWTWKQIAKLHGKAAKEFMKTYGDRGVVALLASGHAPGTWKAECPYAGREPCVVGHKDKGKCPMDDGREWRKGRNADPCSQDAMEVYARMVKKLGRQAKEER
jgi:hypothetical protein